MWTDEIVLRPIGVVRCHRTDTRDDDWGLVEANITHGDMLPRWTDVSHGAGR